MPGRGHRFLVPSLAIVAVLACVPARAQDFTMKFATQTLNDMQHEYIKVYKTELEKATNNRIKVEVYPASQLGVGNAGGLLGLSVDAYDMQSFVFKVPVTTVAGFAGKRIRVLASEGEQSAVAALGASGVPVSRPEGLPALQQGTIDGVNSVLGVFVAFRYYDAAPTLVDTALWPILSVALV